MSTKREELLIPILSLSFFFIIITICGIMLGRSGFPTEKDIQKHIYDISSKKNMNYSKKDALRDYIDCYVSVWDKSKADRRFIVFSDDVAVPINNDRENQNFIFNNSQEYCADYERDFRP